MPMVSDIIKIGFFLKPGTIIVVDGKSSKCSVYAIPVSKKVAVSLCKEY